MYICMHALLNFFNFVKLLGARFYRRVTKKSGVVHLILNLLMAFLFQPRSVNNAHITFSNIYVCQKIVSTQSYNIFLDIITCFVLEHQVLISYITRVFSFSVNTFLFFCSFRRTMHVNLLQIFACMSKSISMFVFILLQVPSITVVLEIYWFTPCQFFTIHIFFFKSSFFKPISV